MNLLLSLPCRCSARAGRFRPAFFRLTPKILFRVAALPPVAGRTERLQILRVQAQIPVFMERLDMVHIHVSAILRRYAAGGTAA